MKKKINKNIPKYKFGAAEVGGTLQGLGAGLSAIPTPFTQIAGAAFSTVGSVWGEDSFVNQKTGKINYGKGLAKAFGRRSASLERESNRIKNSIADRELTEALNYQYHTNPNNSANTNVFAAAEGGIVPGEHYASRREVEVAADGTNAVRYPWDPDGKDTYHVYTNPDGSSAMHNYVFTEEGVRRPNGEKYSDAAEKIIKGTEEGSKLRQISLRKLANEMEEQKMNKGIKKIKKGIPAHEGGLNPYSYNKNLTEFAYWDKDKNEYKKEYLNWVNKLTEQDVKDIFNGKYGDMSTYKGVNKDYIPTVEEARQLMTDKKYGDWHKIGKSFVDNKTQPIAKDPDYLDYKPSDNAVFNTIEAPFIRNRVVANRDFGLGTIYNSTANPQLKPLTKAQLNASKDYYSTNNDSNGNRSINFDGLDYLNLIGPLANLFSGKSEKVDVHAPRREFGPTYYNERPMIEQIGLNRAINNYNAAKRTPNTGAGMQFALQSQMDTDKAIGTALANKENIQNQYAFQNANIYNQWSDVYANAKHTAAVEQAQNDATARNIRRKGVGDLFTNAGKIRRDKKLNARDAALYKLLRGDHDNGLLSYGMQDATLIGLDKFFNYVE